MKVLYIPDSNERYGATESFIRMVTILADNFDVEPILALSCKGRLSQWAEENNFEYYIVNHKACLITPGASQTRKNLKAILFPYFVLLHITLNHIALKKIASYIDLNKIDLVHTNIDRNDLGCLLNKKFGTPHLMHLREFGEEDFNLRSLKFKYPHYLNNYVDRFIAISDAVRNAWILKGIDSSKIVRIYNGIDIPKRFKQVYPGEEDVVKFVIAGSLQATKGQIIAIEALSKLIHCEKQDAELFIIGDSNVGYKEYLEIKVREYCVEDKVHFWGYVKNPNFIQFDCGLMCSKSEGFGRVTAEYMSAGLPVIASDSGANPELIIENVNGLLFRCNDAKDLSLKMKYMITNKELLSNYGRAARRIAIDKYNSDDNAQEIFGVYHTLIKKLSNGKGN